VTVFADGISRQGPREPGNIFTGKESRLSIDLSASWNSKAARIACGYNLEALLRLGIKQVGDHTRRLDLLEVGDPVIGFTASGTF
jgi:hypothetical protein